jgi:hypothetical protein
MRRSRLSIAKMLLIFLLTIFSFFAGHMVKNSIPTASAVYIDDLMDICYLTSKNIDTGYTDWDEFWLCVAKGLN